MSMDLLCLRSITLSEPMLDGSSVSSDITLAHLDGRLEKFNLQVRYEVPAREKHLPLYRMAMAMPLLNYGLFADEIILKFPVADSDMRLLNDLLDVFSRDIFINKLVRRRTGHLLEEFLPREGDVTPENAGPRARIVAATEKDINLASEPDHGKCGILSSGGKEALLGYGMLKELGADVHPLYINESGGHWRTALTAYRWHSRNEPNTGRVWTNVDRFYLFMLDNLKIVKYHHRRIPSDTYPIRLCIFPVYLFQLLPVFLDRHIGNLLIGSEFDDPRGDWTYRGIRHYFGIYDQHADFDTRMEEWYCARMPGMRQWSALRPISGLVVERVLTARYPGTARYQRSCHSCHFEGDEIVPCGKCTKCLGVMLFLKANGQDSGVMGYRKADADAFPGRLAATRLRLDPDELEHSKHLSGLGGEPRPHAEGIHIHPSSDPGYMPERFRAGIMSLIGQYAKGEWLLMNGEWVPQSI